MTVPGTPLRQGRPLPYRVILVAALALPAVRAPAQTIVPAPDTPPTATVVVVGDADRFTIGQGGFCDARTEVAAPTRQRITVQADRATFFFIRTRLRDAVNVYTCEGDFSFTPAPGLLHIVRYTLADFRCTLELFRAAPGETPQRAPVTMEAGRSCLRP